MFLLMMLFALNAELLIAKNVFRPFFSDSNFLSFISDVDIVN